MSNVHKSVVPHLQGFVCVWHMGMCETYYSVWSVSPCASSLFAWRRTIRRFLSSHQVWAESGESGTRLASSMCPLRVCVCDVHSDYLQGGKYKMCALSEPVCHKHNLGAFPIDHRWDVSTYDEHSTHPKVTERQGAVKGFPISHSNWKSNCHVKWGFLITQDPPPQHNHSGVSLSVEKYTW